MAYIGNTPGTANTGAIPSKTITGPTYNVLTSDKEFLLLADSTSGNITVNLPAVADVPLGFTVYIKKIVSANTITIDGSGSEAINGATTRTITSQWDGIGLTRGNTAWFSFASSGAGAGAGGGGGGTLAGLSDVSISSPNSGEVLTFTGAVWEAAPGASLSSAGGSLSMPYGRFDSALTGSTSLALSTTSLTDSYQYTGTGAAIVYGVTVANVDGENESNISLAIRDSSGTADFYVARYIPVPADMSIELLRRPKVLKQNDRLKFQASASNDFQCSIRYVEFNANADLFNAFYAAGTAAVGTYQTVYTESGTSGSVVESITVANVDGTNPVEVSVRIVDGLADPVLISTMNVPAGASIEICEQPVVLHNTETLRVMVGSPDALHVTVHGRKIA